MLEERAGFVLFERILRLRYARHQDVRLLVFHAIFDQPVGYK